MSDSGDVVIARAVDAPDVAAVKRLFLDYAGWLGVDLCFQNFAEEMATFPAFYEAIWLARAGGAPAGAVGLKDLGHGACEMKRLYVTEAHRGLSIGRRPCDEMLAYAAAAGYQIMRLDTLDRLASAIALYRDLGFVETESYYDNPEKGVIYMALEIDPPRMRAAD
ncbi:MAG: GNAT family N-acetyltransferase [Alphaproteobacteria bacterium]|nr:GNAT family N-acetyltransferase [Alphaproteobacteria bacterium]